MESDIDRPIRRVTNTSREFQPVRLLSDRLEKLALSRIRYSQLRWVRTRSPRNISPTSAVQQLDRVMIFTNSRARSERASAWSFNFPHRFHRSPWDVTEKHRRRSPSRRMRIRFGSTSDQVVRKVAGSRRLDSARSLF